MLPKEDDKGENTPFIPKSINSGRLNFYWGSTDFETFRMDQKGLDSAVLELVNQR